MAAWMMTYETAGSDNDLFPASPRVIYRKAPLIQVSSELRFPTILRIESDAQALAEFQEKIRRSFPLFVKTAQPALVPPQLHNFPQQLPPDVLQMLSNQFGGAISYQFRTENNKSTVTLTAMSLSLVTTEYNEWRDFFGNLAVPLTALKTIYGPAFFARVGLRYVDAIDRESLGLANRPWTDLLQSALLGELALPPFERNLESAARQLRAKLPDGTGTVALRHGYGSVLGQPHARYVIDFDFFTEQKTEVGRVESILAHFNKLAGNGFRWCITPQLHTALEPAPAG